MVSITSIDQLDATPHAIAFPGKDPKTVRLLLERGESVPAHRHPNSDVVLYLVSGEIELELDDESHRLEAGDIVHFDGAQDISPTAHEDSIALIILSPKSEATDPG